MRLIMEKQMLQITKIATRFRNFMEWNDTNPCCNISEKKNHF